MAEKFPRMPDCLEKLDIRTDKSAGPAACWPWLGGHSVRGGPRIHWNGDGAQARVLLWEILNGPLPPKRTVGMTCGSPECMNPGHMRLRAYQDDVARFWENVRKSDGCWEWTGAVSRNGKYGVFRLPGSQVRCPRYSWELHYGPIGDASIFVCHRCDNPPCVRPDHLFLGTAKDNHDDMMAKGRHAHGERLSRASRAAHERRKARLAAERGAA